MGEGPRVQKAPGRSGAGGWGSNPGAARLGVGGEGGRGQAAWRVRGGQKVTAARQDRARVPEVGHKFRTAEEMRGGVKRGLGLLQTHQRP